MKTYIKGTYKKSIYKSEKGYVIGLFKIKETNDKKMEDFINKTITFTGYFHELNENDMYTFYGEEIEHPRYGFQYQVEEYEQILPQDKDGIVLFLSSGLFKGIGEKQAIKIVDTLGEDALNRILEDPNVLNLVPKLTKKKAEEVYNTLLRYGESHETIVHLTEYGFSMKEALSIYNTYKTITLSKIQNNVYDLIDEVEEITYSKIEEVRKKLNILDDDTRRIKATILYSFKELTFQTGNTYLEYEEIYDGLVKVLKLELSFPLFEQLLAELVNERKLFKEEYRYYLYDLYEAERKIVQKLKKLKEKEEIHYNKLEKTLQDLQTTNGILYNDKQKEAIEKALQKNLLIITGGPGTGKTTIIKAITTLYQTLNKYKYHEMLEITALLAPTGRASKRMSEATSLPASTIHRFLKWNKETNKFGIDAYNKNNHRLIIIDEVSMIDLSLFHSLLEGLTDNIQLILVGDFNQLPSVGPGQILKDMIESEIIETIHLDYLYRQSEDSYITTLAYEIKEDNLRENFLEAKSDYQFLACNGYTIKKNLQNLSHKLLEKGYSEKRVQFMAPMYRGENGIDNLNKELQNIFNPQDKHKKEIIYGDVIFRENDKVLQLVNMPEENIFNGDIGYIEEIIPATISETKKNEVYVNYDGNIVRYLPKDLVKIKHGYIISIHKSQGSEFEMVVMPITNSYKRMLYRKLIYTGITRAKKKLILIGEPDAFTYSIDNSEEYIRKTYFLERLRIAMHKK